MNLIDNAIRLVPNSKIICIEVLLFVTKNQRNYVPLQVRDRGSDIKPEEVKQVTERFYRSNSARPKGGFGLGVAIAS